MITIPTKKLRPGAKLPKPYSEGAAGADLCACIDNTVGIPSGETVAIPTGLAVEIPEGYAGFILARSGLAISQGLAPANKVGLIDSDYRGELILQLHNHSNAIRTVEPGQRLAQMVILPIAAARYVEAEALSDTERGSGGFGSTGQF